MKGKVVQISKEITSKDDPFPNKISLVELRKIWNDENCSYTDEELMLIREWMYTIAGVVVRLVNEKLRNTDQNKLKKAS